MPHLSLDYGREVEEHVDIPALCRTLRDALAATGIFELGGIRVRAHRADAVAIADDAERYGFIDMELRIGEGRSEEVRRRVAEAVYDAAEAALRPQIRDLPFMLSLELREIATAFSIKRWSSVHEHVAVRKAG
ncbi:MAG TPA: 5-carboxymethyl-2-hydroxymuconate isomerase [Paracoccaceae bacterium]|nr:5-carboxymethyl-2-hydroxymuconate isomerase [Paracoccaceae bacterium]